MIPVSQPAQWLFTSLTGLKQRVGADCANAPDARPGQTYCGSDPSWLNETHAKCAAVVRRLPPFLVAERERQWLQWALTILNCWQNLWPRLKLPLTTNVSLQFPGAERRAWCPLAAVAS